MKSSRLLFPLALAACLPVFAIPPLPNNELQVSSADGLSLDFGKVGFGETVTRGLLISYHPTVASWGDAKVGRVVLDTGLVRCVTIPCPTDPGAFQILQDDCSDRVLKAGGPACKLTVAFKPEPFDDRRADRSFTTYVRLSGEAAAIDGSAVQLSGSNAMTGMGLNAPAPQASDNAKTDQVYDYAEKVMGGLFKPVAKGSFYSRCYAGGSCLAEQGGVIYLYNGQSMTPVMKVEEVLKLMGGNSNAQ